MNKTMPQANTASTLMFYWTKTLFFHWSRFTNPERYIIFTCVCVIRKYTLIELTCEKDVQNSRRTNSLQERKLYKWNDSPETRKNGICEHLSTKKVAGPNAGVKRLIQKNTAWAKPWPKPPAAKKKNSKVY